MSKLLPALLAVALSAAAAPSSRGPSPVTPLFDLESPEGSPFPSDRFTVADSSQFTGRRVNLPMPGDCAVNVSECEDRTVLNQLDGFNMQPRISIPFSGAIDPLTVTTRTVFLLDLAARPSSRDAVVGINQIVWDTATSELSFRPERPLEQHTKYALVVTTAVRDAAGAPIAPPAAFRAYLTNMAGQVDPAYQHALLYAQAAARPFLDRKGGTEMAVLSIFTTQSSSHVVEGLRAAVRRAPAPVLEFGVAPGGARAVFRAAEIESITNNVQTAVDGPLTSLPLAQAVENMQLVRGAVGTVAFGTFRALDFTVHPSGHVPLGPSHAGTPASTGTVNVAFNLWLPSGVRPPNGWPVAICAHGSNVAKNFCFSSASVMASHGLAVIAINAMGHGGGPRTTMTIGLAGGRSVTLAAPGNGYDANGDGAIATWEPQRAARPFALLNTTGTILQTTVFYFQLMRGIEAGVDVDGDGLRDLDPSRIYYYGHSLGSSFGMLIYPFEPAIRAAVFVVPVGSLIYNSLLSPPFRPLFGQMLGARSPSLLNEAQGIDTIDGREVAAPRFNENLPLRDRPPLVNDVPGALAIQRVVDHIAWAAQVASTVAAAPLLRRSPPSGLAARPFIVQMARSDPASTNPSTSETIRAGDFADRVFLYRHDVNFGNPGVLPNSHLFMSSVGGSPAVARVALGAQHQIGAFFESDGRTLVHPTPAELWESPIRKPLPEDLLFMPRPR